MCYETFQLSVWSVFIIIMFTQVMYQVDLIMVVMFLSCIIWTTGAIVFSYYERWELGDALYYCFATLTTIGGYQEKMLLLTSVVPRKTCLNNTI